MRIPNLRWRVLVIRLGEGDAGYRMLDTRYWIQDAGYLMLDGGANTTKTRNTHSTISNNLSTTNTWLLTHINLVTESISHDPEIKLREPFAPACFIVFSQGVGYQVNQ